MGIFNKLKNIFLYAGLEKQEYDSIESNMTRMNLNSIIVLATITVIAMVAMIILSFEERVWVADRIYYIECLCISVGILTVSKLGLIRSKSTTLIVEYLYLATIFVYGITIGSTQPSQTSVSFLIFIMVGPLLFYDRPLKINIFIWIFNGFFLYNSIAIKTPEARDTDVVNGLIYGFISCFLNTSAIVYKIKRVWLEKKMEIMAETDSLTKLKNRNHFDQTYQEYAQKAKSSVTCIYLDANGLHKINNTKGHEAGDEMLRYLAEQTIQLFGEEDAYRIGGDEYMVICCDEELSKIKEKTKELTKRLKTRQYSVSVGIVSEAVEELDMEALIKKADAQMYFEKKKYYEQNGFDRRRQR